MNNSLYFSLVSLFYVVLVYIVFNFKDHINSRETKIYTSMIYLSIFIIVFEILQLPGCILMNKYPLFNLFVSKTFIVLLYTWVYFLAKYSFFVSYSDSESNLANVNYKSVKRIGFYLYLVVVLLLYVLPIDYYFPPGAKVYYYSLGPAISFLYLAIGITIVASIVFILCNLKNVKQKKYIPLLVYVVLCLVTAIVQNINPLLLLSSAVIAFVTVIMFFTIENPDLKVITELVKAKNMVQVNNQKKSLFVYDVVQQLKEPINNIKNIINDKEYEDMDSLVDKISTEVNKLDFKVNTALDISTVNSEKVKVYDKEYDIRQLFKELSIKYSSLVDKKIDFRTDIKSELPEVLYGDVVRLKQVISSLLNNSLKSTKEGYIDLSVSCLLRQDICRLFILVSDSGCGMDIMTLDKVFESSDKLNMDDFESSDLPMPLVKKMVEYIGGTIMIESEEGKGTKVTIVLDQKKGEKQEEDSLTDLIGNMKKILVVDNEHEKTSLKTEKLFEEVNVHAIYMKYGVYALKKLRNREEFDLIVINDNIEKISCKDLIVKLKEVDEDIKIVVIGSKEREEFYLSRGITGYVVDSGKTKDMVDAVVKFI